MCKKTQFKYCPSTIDKCMRKLIGYLNLMGIKTVACCCGHGKYPMTIVVKRQGYHYELFVGETLFRKRKFYKKDKQGYYYIPEVLNRKL